VVALDGLHQSQPIFQQMKKYLVGFWYSLPIQLFFLHFRRYQILLIFWYILFATVGGRFMENYGADSLFLAPEYYNQVNALSTAFVGMAVGIFIMSWNITTFILHNRNIRFLVTTAQPFLKYCINNGIIPLLFLLFYFFEAIAYGRHRELQTNLQIFYAVGGFLGGFILAVSIAFGYFFGADKRIYYTHKNNIQIANKNYDAVSEKFPFAKEEKKEIRVDWFLSARFHIRKPRDVRHYSHEFLDRIFKHHHISAIIAFVLAFVLLIGLGFSSDSRLFQVPAAASITVFFALIIAVAGAFTVFFKNWSIVILVVVYLGMNYLYEKDIIDPRNKAYGLNYLNKAERPDYTKENILALASNENMQADKLQFIQRLNKWKAQQKEDKPVMYIINTSGGGTRSATFTFNAMQKLDTLMHGELMKKTFFINGASGGLLGAAYFRELYNQKLQGHQINLQNRAYADDIAKDLLNPLFSSFVTRDIIGPVQKFTWGGFEYTKDRGYAFEQKLDDNTHGFLGKSLKDYKDAEDRAIIPTMFFNSVVSRDGRKMIMCTQPVRFLMKQMADSNKLTFEDPDMIDFNSFFAKQQSTNISILSALRMNATFPYVLPNVWLPTNPIIDVMDAGLRDNFGQENTLRFVDVFKDWLKENTSKVVIVQIRDRKASDWDKPYESKELSGIYTRPALLLQYNWFKLQDYYQHDELAYLSQTYGPKFQKVCFQYTASSKEAAASLSFHLTTREKQEIALAMDTDLNKTEMKKLELLMK
jgi:hypothetical protein